MPDLAAITALLAPAFPPELWYAAPVVLGLLGVAAGVDAFRGRVPDFLTGLAFLGGLFLSASHEGWATAGQRALIAFLALLILFFTNGLYKALSRREAFGMGDAKWTSAAAASFGLPALFWAWVIAAWLGLLWMAARRLLGCLFWQLRPEAGYIHFAPFLWIGLAIKLYAIPLYFTP